MLKRAVSAVIATVLIILITIAAISILWVFVIPMIEEIYEFEEHVNLEIVQEGYTAWDPLNKLAEIQVKRGSDNADIIGFDFIFVMSNGESLIHKIRQDIRLNSKQVYYFNFSGISSGELTSVKIYPVYEQEKKGSVTSILKISNVLGVPLHGGVYVEPVTGKITGNEGNPSCSHECNSDGCIDGNTKFICGENDEDSCRDRIAVDCDDGETCTGGVCAAEAGGCIAEAESVTCAGVECGSKTNNCGDVVTCANSCDNGQICLDWSCKDYVESTSLIKVYPSLNVRAGEEVVFNAENYVNYGNQFLWDFGDGYSLDKATGGSAVSHYFNGPGVYNVTLSVSGTSTSKFSQLVSVTGKNMYELPPILASPILYLPLEGNLEDYSSHELDGSWIENPNYSYSLIKGMNHSVASLGSSYIKIEGSSLGKLNQFTISFWMKKEAENSPGTVFKIGDSISFFVGNGLSISLNSDAGSANIGYWGLVKSKNQNWNHYVLVYDGNKVTYFVNGVLEDPISSREGMSRAEITGNFQMGDIYLGADSSGENKISALMKDFKIYDKAYSIEEITRKFEVYHANPRSRSAQYLYVQIPQGYEGKRLIVKVSNDKNFEQTLINKIVSRKEEKIFMNNSVFSRGNYTLTSQIIDGAEVIEETRSYFTKLYDGAPKFGITEDNSFIINGKLFFPITSWLAANYQIPDYAARGAVNALMGEQFVSDHDKFSFKTYIKNAENNGLYVLGPDTFIWKGGNVSKNLEVVEYNYNEDYLFMWHFYDEPDAGVAGGENLGSGPSLSALTYLAQSIDKNQRPTGVNYIGKYFLEPFQPTENDYWDAQYTFIQNEDIFGRKHTTTDVVGEDFYPVEDSVGYNGNVISEYIRTVDQFYKQTRNLVPVMTYVEEDEIFNVDTQAVTPVQAKMLVWLSIIHQAKAINWFTNDFGPGRTQEMIAEQALIKKHITELTNIILGPESFTKVLDNSNIKGNRVETMVRNNGSEIWLFAARASEVGNDGVTSETNDITTTFTIDGFGSGTAIVYNESRQVAIDAGSFKDVFKSGEVHIYKITSA